RPRIRRRRAMPLRRSAHPPILPHAPPHAASISAPSPPRPPIRRSRTRPRADPPPSPTRPYHPPVPIIRHGPDIVPAARIAKLLADHGDRFLARCFTPAEAAYAASAGRRDERLAARFAAKEAALKAIGTGWRSGIAWTDVEVVRLPAGEPTLRVSGRAAEV